MRQVFGVQVGRRISIFERGGLTVKCKEIKKSISARNYFFNNDCNFEALVWYFEPIALKTCKTY